MRNGPPTLNPPRGRLLMHGRHESPYHHKADGSPLHRGDGLAQEQHGHDRNEDGVGVQDRHCPGNLLSPHRAANEQVDAHTQKSHSHHRQNRPQLKCVRKRVDRKNDDGHRKVEHGAPEPKSEHAAQASMKNVSLQEAVRGEAVGGYERK